MTLDEGLKIAKDAVIAGLQVTGAIIVLALGLITVGEVPDLTLVTRVLISAGLLCLLLSSFSGIAALSFIISMAGDKWEKRSTPVRYTLGQVILFFLGIAILFLAFLSRVFY
jgi:hypothetical protein